MNVTLEDAMRLLKANRNHLTRQQIRTLKGQALAGDPTAAVRGLRKLLERKKQNERDDCMKSSKVSKILVCIKEPGEDPRIDPLFDNTLESFQKMVGGYIETVTIASDLVLICNEEGRINGSTYNVTVCGCDFYGPVLAVGVADDEFASVKGVHVSTVLNMLRGDKEKQTETEETA